MPGPILDLQTRVLALGFDPLGLDNGPGNNTAQAVVAAWRAGKLDRHDPAVDAAADFMLSTAPAQRDLPHLTGLTPDLYRDDPARPGGCIWTPAGADWETHNLIPVIVPGATRPLRLHRKAAFRLVLGFGECVVFEELPDAEMQSFCLRHMNWDPTEDLTTHGYGFAIDRDWNRNHKMERIEGDLSRWAPSLQRWGNTLGDHWKDSATKKIRDAMHVQAVRVR